MLIMPQYLPHTSSHAAKEIRKTNAKILFALDVYLQSECEKIQQTLCDSGADSDTIDEIMDRIRSNSHLELIKLFKQNLAAITD
jgi:hypothetical protein